MYVYTSYEAPAELKKGAAAAAAAVPPPPKKKKASSNIRLVREYTGLNKKKKETVSRDKKRQLFGCNQTTNRTYTTRRVTYTFKIRTYMTLEALKGRRDAPPPPPPPQPSEKTQG